MSDTHITLNNEAATHALAAQVANFTQVGDVILLQGGLGVGKSSFARGFIQHLTNHETEVTSPTFTLIQTYDSTKGEIWHCDFYRIDSFEDALETGIEDALHEAITLIEWPEKILPILPEDRLSIALEYGENEGSRLATIAGFGRFKDRFST